LNGTPKKKEFLGQGSLTGIRVRNDGESSALVDF